MASETRKVAEFIATEDLVDIPERVLKDVKRSAIEGIGCALAGSATEPVRTLTDYVTEWETVGQSSIWGTSHRAAVPFSAMANSMAVHQLDYDDTIAGGFHPACVTLPTAVAIAEANDTDGAELLTSLAVGYEVLNVIALALNPREFVNSGFYNSVGGIFGSYAVAGRMLDLNVETLSRGIGIAATQAAGLYSGTTTKRINAPKAAMGGIIGAELARRGIESSTNALEAEYSGFLPTFSPDPRPEEITERLGSYDFDVYRKLYPCIRSNQPAIECTKLLVEEYDVSSEEIERVVVHSDTSTVKYTVESPGGGYEVRTTGNAKVSLPYCVAAMIIHGEFTLDQLREDRINDPAVQSLLRRVEVQADHSFDELPYDERYQCIVEMELTGGRTIEKHYEALKGNPSNPLTADELEHKFRECASRVLESDAVDELHNVLSNLEDVEDIGVLVELLTTTR